MSPSVIEPSEAIERLCGRLSSVASESLSVGSPSALAGRVLAAPLRLDRDSPACDVSAMDGFAVRLEELKAGPLSIEGECLIGESPAELPAGRCLRIYTGSPVPVGADTVVRLERVAEAEGQIRLDDPQAVTEGADIRLRGENAAAGAVVLERGMTLTAAAVGAVATIGAPTVEVVRSIRVAVITTGNELERGRPGPLPDWRLRDSNGPALSAMLGDVPWIESVEWTHAGDTLEATRQEIESALARADAVVLTGGVSKGAHDYVPDAVRMAGGEVVFHRVRARPGQPTLGAVAAGKPLLGLPGNPLSVLTTARRLLAPALRKLAGHALIDPPAPQVTLEAWSGKPQPLCWWRPVTLVGSGSARLASLRGSGDVCGPATTDGFVEIPPLADTTGPYDYHAWRY